MFTEQQVNQYAEEFNKKFDLPFISEEMELSILKNVLGQAVKFLTPEALSAAFKGVVPSAPSVPPLPGAGANPLSIEGIALAGVKANLVKTLNEKIDLPILNEEQEAKLLSSISDFFVDKISANPAFLASLLPK
ncbi:MAG: hypothetical protein EAZ97_05880 [Bacteroidetes bacterium]|nr:MAG: hypothetical protein EAZ97_05880 [Bacteroidota bacterium]